MSIDQSNQGSEANEHSIAEPADVSFVDEKIADQKNNLNLDELIALATHCEKAAEQLRELMDLPALDDIESAAKKSGEAGPSGFLENTRNDCISASLPLDNFEKIKRISRAAVEGFSLDREDLMEILKDESAFEDLQKDVQRERQNEQHKEQHKEQQREQIFLKSLLTQLEVLLPRTQEEIVTKFCAAYLADNNITQAEGEPLAVPPHIELLAEILEIREPLKCYEEAARISREAVNYAMEQVQTEDTSIEASASVEPSAS